MHIATITRHYKGKTYRSYLLRHFYREGGKVKHLTLANLSKLPEETILVLRTWLAGSPVPNQDDRFKTIRTTPHGHVAAVLGTLRRIGLDRVISSKPSRESQLAIALIVLRIISPGSKRANLTSLQTRDREEYARRGTAIRRHRTTRNLRSDGLVARLSESY